MPFTRTTDKRNNDIPTSSMGDIAFLLLVFFIVTVVFTDESGLVVKLPRAEAHARAQALLVDREALEGYQAANDALMASETLKRAFRTDVEPLLREARVRSGGADDPVAAYRASGYRARVAAERPAASGAGGGIV